MLSRSSEPESSGAESAAKGSVARASAPEVLSIAISAAATGAFTACAEKEEAIGVGRALSVERAVSTGMSERAGAESAAVFSEPITTAVFSGARETALAAPMGVGGVEAGAGTGASLVIL